MSERLWAPWRMEYLQNPNAIDGCLFCVKAAEQQDDDNKLLYRGEKAFIMLNAYPYSNGHLMVAPYKHTADLNELDDDEFLDVHHQIQLCVNLLKKAFSPHGFNLGVNMGKVAGAGVEDHIHWHIVPRWNGDTNFMPVIADTRVLPESLESNYKRLKALLESVK